MTSERHRKHRQAYVWIWLPGAEEPVVAGLLAANAGGGYAFTYGRSYLARDDAVSLFPDELPLRPGTQRLRDDALPSCLRDAAPDAWGRRVILHRLLANGLASTNDALDEIDCLLASGSDRIGALDFQASAIRYLPRDAGDATLAELAEAADRLDRGEALSPALGLALQHGTSVGGARPKALLAAPEAKLIAKFSTSTDIRNVVKAEYVAMRLAARVGLDVAPVTLTSALGRDVLLVQRFDRLRTDSGWRRRGMLSALTLLGMQEWEARYAGYIDLAHRIRRDFAEPRASLRELFGRMVFNVLCGNTDDHARNHAAFWDGREYRLTPAYDLCPQGRIGGEASQAMLLTAERRDSRLVACLAAAPALGIGAAEARALIDRQIQTITRDWGRVCDEAGLSATERDILWGRDFLNAFCLEGYAES
jgi:serine/threonine-protein kinase HipA